MSVLFGTLIVITATSLWQGFVLKLLWGWFVSPIFGLPKLAFMSAAGLLLLTSFLTAHHIPRTNEQTIEALNSHFSMPALVLCVGWIFHFFV